ncbi:MAG: [LysW]-lysine hydrolase [Acidobacteria bacterium]|nr:[LysW]-lysine hydrolase [Acidobacteriota bacterium]
MNDTTAVELLEDLCSVYSPSGDEAAAVALMVGRARDAGLDAHVDAAGNFVSARGPADGPCIVLLGHIDTVSGFIEPRTVDGRFFGRGSVDAKGPLAAFVVALARLPSPIAARIVIVGAVEEEAPSSKGAHHALGDYAPAFVVIGEPSGASSLTIAYKGRVSLELRSVRPHAHTAAAVRSLAADAVEAWSGIEAWCARFNEGRPVFDTIDPYLASFNSATDGFEDSVDLRASFRLPLGFPTDTLQEEMASIARGLGPLSWHGHIPAFKSTKRNPLVTAMLQSMRREGLEPTFKLKTGTSDMNIVGPVWRCPIVAYGPGDSNLDHTPHEHVVLEEYLRAIRVLTRALGALVSRAEHTKAQ